MFKKVVMVVCSVTSMAYAVLPEYVNVITDIQEIHGGSTYSLVLKCQQQDPIITYDPATYEESLSDEIYRSFMPGTTLADGICDSSGIIEQTDSGVAIVLLGRLKEKIVGDYMIILTVEI